MKRCLLILCSFVAANLVLADDPYACDKSQIINPPTNISTPWIYPANWNSSLPAPQYAPNQNCAWKIMVPKGFYAHLQLKFNYQNTSVLTLTDSTGYVETIQVAINEPYFLLDPSFTVELQANQGGLLGMTVQWLKVNTQIYPSTYQVHKSSLPVSLFGGDFDNSTVIKADTRVSLLVFPPPAAMLEFLPYLRLTQVYDGDSINAKHIGNLYQIMTTYTNYISSGNSLTLYSLFPGYNIKNLVLLQDYADVQQF